MKSIYQHILGSDFNRLHPRIQDRTKIGELTFGDDKSSGVLSELPGKAHELAGQL